MKVLELIKCAKTHDPFAPVTVLTPSNLVGLQLRRELVDRSQSEGPGLLNVRFLTISSVAEILASPTLPPGRLSGPVRLAAVACALAQTPGLTELARHAPSVEQVDRLFQDFRNLPNEPNLKGSLGVAYQQYRALTRSLADTRDLFRHALNAVSSANPVGDLGALILAAPPLGAPAHVEEFLANLETSGHLTRASTEDCLVETTCWLAPDAEEECRSAASQIAEWAQLGIPLSRIAILCPNRTLYGALLGETLEAAAIPFNARTDRTQAETETGRTLAGFLAVVKTDYRRADVIGWLASAPILNAGVPIPAHKWDKLSKAFRVTKGLPSWRIGMERAIRASVQPGNALDDFASERIAAESATATSVLEFLAELEADAQGFSEINSWTGLTKWIERFVKRLLPRSVLEQSDSEFLLEQIRALQDLRALIPNPTTEQWMEALERTLGDKLGARAPFGQGVFVGTLDEAVGLKFDAMILLGMSAGNLPRPPRTAFLAAEEMEALGLPGPETQTSLQREVFDAVCRGAAQVVFSYARADLRSLRGALPSPWFLECVAAIVGKGRVTCDDLLSLGEHPRIRSTASLSEGLRRRNPATRQEYQLRALLAGQGSALREADWIRIAWGKVAQRDRHLEPLSVWDGLIRLEATPRLSATGLEDLAACPFRFFLARLLRLKRQREVRSIWETDAMERGTAVHQALAAFFASESNPTQPDRNRYRSLLETTLDLLLETGFAKDSPIWRMDRERLLANLDAFLDRDIQGRPETGMTLQTEFAFGDPVPLEIEVGGVPLELRGAIDRVDYNAATNQATLIDYKTGSGSRYKSQSLGDPLMSGKLYQLPLYGEVVRACAEEIGLPGQPKLRARYAFIEPKLRDTIEIDLDAVHGTFETNLGVLNELLEQGVFPATPGGYDRNSFRNCRYCDFDAICASKRQEHWERKRSDPRLANFLVMTGEGDHAEA